jgi:negative regulator of sigma E activity
VNEFPGVDLDLLADYVDDALADGPERDRVARLVDTDPAWGEAHAALTYGMGAVSTRLRDLGAATGPMPDDVSERLTAALGAALTHEAAPELGRHLHAVPSAGAGRPRSRRLRRWAAPIAVAAGVLAFAAFGLPQLLRDSTDNSTAAPTSARGEAARSMSESAEPPAAGADAATGPAVPFAAPVAPDSSRITASGLDYQRASLAAKTAEKLQRSEGAASADAQREPAAATVVPADRIDPALARLAGREALVDCLDAIGAASGATINVQNVDYARFEGAPALVVRYTVVAVTYVTISGPQCGAPGAGPDTVYQATVG